MLVISCNWCGLSISNIAYSVTPIRVLSNTPMDRDNSIEHLHWDCLPKFVEYMRGGSPPPIRKEPFNFVNSEISHRRKS